MWELLTPHQKPHEIQAVDDEMLQVLGAKQRVLQEQADDPKDPKGFLMPQKTSKVGFGPFTLPAIFLIFFLGSVFKDVLFSPPNSGEMIQFDQQIFQMGGKKPPNGDFGAPKM